MSYETTLNAEIDALISARVAANEPLHPVWIAHSVCLQHEAALIEGADKLFWLHAGHLVARKAVLERVRQVAGVSVEQGAQPRLPGFDHLQTHYIVTRDGDEIAVPTDLLSDGELRGIATRIDAMAETCKAHAREVRRFIRLRPKTADHDPDQRQGAAA